MEAALEKPEACRNVLNIKIPEEDILSKIEEKTEEYKKKISLPGFRKGKVPAKMIKSRYGQTIRGEVIDEAVDESFKKACKDNDITPISSPSVSDMEGYKEGDVSLSIEFEVDPEIEITGYRELNIKPEIEKSGDKEIEDQVEILRAQEASFEKVDRKAEKGDCVTLRTYRSTIDGDPVEETLKPVSLRHRTDGMSFKVGDTGLKELDKALTGLSENDKKEFSIVFPQDYMNNWIAGRKVEIEIEVEKVEEIKLPEIDNDFCKRMNLGENPEELRNLIKEHLDARKEQEAYKEAQEKAIDKLIEDNPFEVPEARIFMYLEKLSEEKQRKGEDGTSITQLENDYKETAIREIKRQRIINYIASTEKIKAKQNEVDERIKQIADYYGQDFDEVKKALRQNNTTLEIRDNIKTEKVLNSLIGERQWDEEDD